MRLLNLERGAALVETALILPMLLVLSIGLAEIGFLVVDRLTAANAARQGARVGAAAGDDTDADTLILIQVERALCSLDYGDVTSVTLFKADADGNPIDPINLANRYTPGVTIDCSGSSTSFSCANGCPWPAASRNTQTTNLDRLGVRVEFTHEWITGFWPYPNATLTEETVMRLEPETGL